GPAYGGRGLPLDGGGAHGAPRRPEARAAAGADAPSRRALAACRAGSRVRRRVPGGSEEADPGGAGRRGRRAAAGPAPPGRAGRDRPRRRQVARPGAALRGIVWTPARGGGGARTGGVREEG